jgi:hypothetical protein
VRSTDSKLAALQRAYNLGHQAAALNILGGTEVRVYTRTPKSKPGWQVSDYRRPYPDGTRVAVLVDAYSADEPPKFFVVPTDELGRLLEADIRACFPTGVRPVSPHSTHAVVKPEWVTEYRDAWHLAD